MSESHSAVERYHAMLDAPDPLKRELARIQLARLRGRPRRAPAPITRSRWAHVPLTDLFVQQGNRVRHRNDGRFETGHEPMHASKSGRCLIVDPTLGRWWCRSCRRGGDAPAYVMDARGWSYRQAAAWLERRYGRPAGPPNPQRSVGRRTEA